MDGGILLIDKPSGMTSRDVDNRVGKLFHTRKVGHLGTLDPFATGLLIVSVNHGGKFLPFLPDEEKTYLATLRLGQKTDTGDLTGKVIDETDSLPDLVRVQEAFRLFPKEYDQLPPMTSAIKQNGVALYELAHKGIEVVREKRHVVISSLEFLSFSGNEILFRAKVSKGTYIRSLGEDLAEAMGSLGYLEALRREKVGSIDVATAISLENVTLDALRNPTPYVDLPTYELNMQENKFARNGVAISLPRNEEKILLTYEGTAVAVYQNDHGIYRCLRGLF